MQKIVLAWAFLGLIFWGCNQQEGATQIVKEAKAKSPDTTFVHTYDDFGIKIDSLQVEEHSIQRNESLYVILDNYHFSPQEIYSIIQKARNFVDLGSLKPGQKYRTYTSSDSAAEISQMVLRPNPLDYVVFDWQQDSLQIYKAARPLTTKTAATSGTIENSLYQTISEEDATPLLAYKLSEIFAWQVNFFGLREGDSFKVLYNKKYINGKYYGIGEVLAAEFTHRGKTYRAYKFEHGETEGYFTETGESVQKALLKTPFKFNQRISSRFSRNRFHPILKKRVPHNGVDYAAPRGTPVLATGDGVVTRARYGRGEGNMIKIRHNSTYETGYMHLSKFANGIHPGTHVEQGQVIAYVGSTGLATGPHLHYSLYKNGHPVNSLAIELPSSDGVPDSLMAAFEKVRDSLDGRVKSKVNDNEGDFPVLTQAR